jgi:hypothetical protein
MRQNYRGDRRKKEIARKKAAEEKIEKMKARKEQKEREAAGQTTPSLPLNPQ